LTGGKILREPFFRVLQPSPISEPLGAMVVAASSIPVIYLLTKYIKRFGEEINSQSLLSQAADLRVDLYASSVIVVSVFASLIGYLFIEGVVGSALSILVLKMGVIQVWNSVLVLMDAVVNTDRLEQIK